jgi:hypothetical protein
MSFIEVLKFYNVNSNIFFKKFSQNFKPKMNLDKFNKYRLYFINFLSDVYINLLNKIRNYQNFLIIKY